MDKGLEAAKKRLIMDMSDLIEEFEKNTKIKVQSLLIGGLYFNSRHCEIVVDLKEPKQKVIV